MPLIPRLDTAENSTPLPFQMSLNVKNPVFGVSDQAPHKPGCTAVQDEALPGVLGNRGTRAFISGEQGNKGHFFRGTEE